MGVDNPKATGLEWAHPLVRDWFVARFGTPTEPQEQGWPHILASRTTLISAPTGSGKTLAAFLICIDALVRKALAGDLTDSTEVLYVSPLKALSNDIQKNLQTPLGEIMQLAAERGLLMPEIRTAVRTGDTLAHERRSMLAHPPHILVTTPESLYILLTAARSREILRSVRTVIVDEIHAMADDKRGSHLTLSLERLEHLTGGHLARIGLSATQKPIEVTAQFLTGCHRATHSLDNDAPSPNLSSRAERGIPAEVVTSPESSISERLPSNAQSESDRHHDGPVIVQVGHRRQMDLSIEVPGSELGAVASNEMWAEIYDRMTALVLQHRSTLIFVNTRRLAERVALHLGERLGKDAVAAHHGSLSRKLRLEAEKKLKAGEIRALVATASLELGIDIGSVDLVCQIGSTRSIAVALQRIGRAGHWRGAIPKGRIFTTTRDDLLECAALVRAIHGGELDRLEVPEAPLDILAQQIVAMCAAEDWKEDELYALVRRAYPYRNLKREDFEEIIEMLSDGIAGSRGRYGAYLHRDKVNGMLRARRGSRLAAITSGGAIPENSLYTVIAQPEGGVVGTVDEDFAVESLAGDIFLLGNTSWRIRRVQQSGRVLVEDAQGAPPNVPFWRGEAPARTDELSKEVADLREKISSLAGEAVIPISATDDPAASVENRITAENFDKAVNWLKAECALDQSGAEQAVAYIVAGRAVLRAVPTQKTIVAERFFDESGGMQLVIHAPFGGRINKAWGLALRKRFCRSFNFELQAAATDNGLNISLAEQHSFPLGDVFRFLHPASVKKVLEQAVLDSPYFGTRWRWDAGRSLALLRFRGGKKIPPPIQRMRADDLLAAVFPEAQACQENIVGEIKIPDHPLIREVMKDVLTEAMDIDGLERILTDIYEGRIECIAVDTPVPSQFSHEILNANPYAYLDDAPLEERRARAVEMRRVLPESVLTEIGRLDPAAIAEVRDEAWPDVRDAEELHDALLTLVALPQLDGHDANGPVATKLLETVPGWMEHFQTLADDRRATRALLGGRGYWVAAERAETFLQIFPSAYFETPPPKIGAEEASREDALRLLMTGWMGHCGPVTASELARALGLSTSEIENTLLRLESSGAILRGHFAGTPGDEIEWCERRLLARIHRQTLGALRRQIQPVTAAQFMQWLLRWQHVTPETQLLGERGTLEALQQLQGFEAPANAWERQILARRVAGYDPKALDQLCLTGAVGWGRLSPHPATLEITPPENRRVIPTSVAPITFFVREEADWMLPRRETGEAEATGLSPDANKTLLFLRQHGASFFADIVRGTGKLKSEVETALWELVAAGLITADGFDNLRALIDPKRRSGQGSGKTHRPRHSVGRWSLLYPSFVEAGSSRHPAEAKTDGRDQPAPTSRDADRAQALEATCRMLLKRYGVVFRDLLTRETILPKWRELLLTLRRLEDRGEIRGGRFVSGFLGEQFALPLAVESLRAQRNQPASGQIVTVSAADPLNLAGIVVPGERVAANSGKRVAFRDGVLVSAEELSWPIPFTATR
jgi:ATP-dependent Lhr-like helicase